MTTQNLEPQRHLDPALLNNATYTESLLGQAVARGLLSPQQLEVVQLGYLGLLAKQVERFTSGESSSVRNEVARHLMDSLLFVVGLRLKTCPHPDDALALLLHTPAQQLFDEGMALLRRKLQRTKLVHTHLTKTLLHTPNVYYRSTLADGIRGFFKLYDPRFGAQEIHITADYPAFLPPTGLVGIEFMAWYTEVLTFENDFCRHFDDAAIDRLLRGIYGPYEELLINLYEPVLLTALCCVLAGRSPHALALRPGDITALNARFRPLTAAELQTVLAGAVEPLQLALALPAGICGYVSRSLPKAAALLQSAAETGTLHKLLAPPAAAAPADEFQFDFGAPMPPQQYSALLDELCSCRYLADKLALAQQQITSLTDFSNLLLDAELEDDELAAFVALLGPAELAALHALWPDDETGETAELRTARAITARIATLPGPDAQWVEAAAAKLAQQSDPLCPVQD